VTPCGGLTACDAEAVDQTNSTSGPTTHPLTSTTTPTPNMTTITPSSPSVPRVAPMTPALTSAPCAAPMTPPAASSTTLVLPPTAQPLPHVLLVGVVPVSPVVHPHLMWTHGATGFLQPKLYITATLSPVLKSVRTTLIDPHWWAAMEEEYATLMSNDTWDLVL
jgi:hypothetical protein